MMEKIEVTPGVFLVNIPACGLSVLCGCPPDVTKHLMKRGLITERSWAGVVRNRINRSVWISSEIMG